jgi:hypothetical protein
MKSYFIPSIGSVGIFLVNIKLLLKFIDKVRKVTFIKERLSTGAEHFNMLFLVYSGIAESDL